MLSWASSQFEKIAQTVAPPPTDPASRFVYCCQKGEENEAMQLASQLPGCGVIVNPTKQQVPLHIACTHGMMQLTRHLLNQPGASLDMVDGSGNTMLHCAAMCTQPAGLELVKMLVNEMGANVCVKNFQGKTPYDVATLNNIRQYLLPIQLQQETREALANGGQGLPPGIDMGGLKIANMTPPPPMGMPGATVPTPHPPAAAAGGGPPPPVGPPPQGMPSASSSGLPASPYLQPPNPFGQSISMTPTATTAAPVSSPYHQPPYAGVTPPVGQGTVSLPPAPVQPAQLTPVPTPPAQPMSTPVASTPPTEASPGDKHSYALVGSSSAAIYKPPPGSGGIRPDGFHSSSSDKRLQQKYGHSSANQYSHIPPPPSSGGISLGAVSGATGSSSIPSAPTSGGPNPYAGGMANRQRPNRYVNYNPISGQSPAPAAVPRPYASYGAPSLTTTPATSHYNVFRPGGTAQAAPAPASTGGTPGGMPPPPFQLQQPTSVSASSPAYQPPSQSVPSVYPQKTASPSYAAPSQQTPLSQTSPFARPPTTSPAPAAAAMFATPSATSPTAASGTASALFSSPAGDASTAFSSPVPSPAKAASPQAAVASPAMPTPPISTEKNQSTAVNTFSSPPLAAGATPPAVAVPDQVAFSNRDVSGVSVMSNASDFFSKPIGATSASDAFSSPPKVEESQPVAAPPAKPVDAVSPPAAAPTVGRSTTPANDLGQVEEEDFDKMDEIPLSPHATSHHQPPNPGMPPPPFSRT